MSGRGVLGRHVGLELQSCLQVGLCAARDEDAFKAAMAVIRLVCFERVFAGFERGKVEGAILCGGGAGLSAGGLIAENDRDARERSRMQISEAAGKGTGARRLDLDGMWQREISRG